MANAPLHFVKIGGSVITDKSQAFCVQPEAITRFAQDFAAAYTKKPDDHYVVGNGAGSFGHYLAHTLPRDTSGGFAAADGARIHAAVVQLNTMVVDALIAKNIPAISLSASAFVCLDAAPTFQKTVIKHLLDHGVVVSIYGDILPDNHDIWRILSTEELFTGLATALHSDYKLGYCALLSNVAGVLDAHGAVIKTIGHEHHRTAAIHDNDQFDVTGGMASKLTYAKKLAHIFDQVRIADGLQHTTLQKIFDNQASGTVILP